MSLNIGKNMDRSGLLLHLDAGQHRSSIGRRTNILDWDAWVAGDTGSASATGKQTYNQNGQTSENSRITDTNPWGDNDVVWRAVATEFGSGDGGWNTTSFSIDHTKMYRFSVWVKCVVKGTSNFYLGVDAFQSDAATNNGVLGRTNNNVNTNPYFEINDDFNQWSENDLNTWYLVVGHVFPSGSGTGNGHPDTGVYKLDGTKLTGNNGSDFVWQPDNYYARHRTYQFYASGATEEQRYYQPRVDVCDGSEPTIIDLLNNTGNYWRDLSGYNHHFRLGSGLATNPRVQLNKTTGAFEFYRTTYPTAEDGGEGRLDGTDYSLEALKGQTYYYQDHTTELWIKMRDLSVYDPTDALGSGFEKTSVFLVHKGNHSGWQYRHDNGTLIYQIWDGTTLTSKIPGASLATMQVDGLDWAQIVATASWTGSDVSVKIYANGTYIGANSYTNITPHPSITDDIRIGFANERTSNYTYYSNVDVAIAKLYARTMSDEEVAFNFEQHRGRFGI